MILPPGHAEEIRRRRAFAPRERWLIRGVLGVLGLLAVVLIVSLAAGEDKAAPGCVSVSLAYSTGGAHIHRCGDAARSLCQGVGHAGGITGAPAQTVAVACRKAGVPVG
ncbi:MAG: hypothetical protein ACJ780_30205 [Solirubrobacteraceae bacterium]